MPKHQSRRGVCACWCACGGVCVTGLRGGGREQGTRAGTLVCVTGRRDEARGQGTRRRRATDTAGPRAVEYTHKSGV
eukprot:5111093-Prymnesium_polylepis.1